MTFDIIKCTLRGATSGFLATIPMTIVMDGLWRCLPWSQQYPLPPRLIGASLASKAGIRHHLTEQQESELSWALHFLFGSTMGAAYGAIVSNARENRHLKGALFGCFVWAMSYEGWLPSLGVLPSAEGYPRRRTALMIAAHIVWGVALSEIDDYLRKLEQQDPEQIHVEELEELNVEESAIEEPVSLITAV